MTAATPSSDDAWALSRGRWRHRPVAEARLAVACSQAAPALARRELVARLRHVLAAPERELVELVASELVTNSVRHSGAAAGAEITVHAAVSEDVVRLEVLDAGRGFATPPAGAPRQAGGEGGLGLVLLARLATRWGVGVEDTTCVWAEFPRERREDRERAA